MMFGYTYGSYERREYDQKRDEFLKHLVGLFPGALPQSTVVALSEALDEFVDAGHELAKANDRGRERS